MDVETITIPKEEYKRLTTVSSHCGDLTILNVELIEENHILKGINHILKGKLEFVKTQVDKLQDEIVRRYIG